VNAIYDEISLLREELLEKITFENNRTKTDERLDVLEELTKEHTKRIETHNGHIGDLFKNQGSGGHTSDGMASGEVKQMIDDLQDQMELRQIKNEADMMNRDLLDKISKLTERLDL
jgi:flagellar motility protein MotE (MotC chaperone)